MMRFVQWVRESNGMWTGASAVALAAGALAAAPAAAQSGGAAPRALPASAKPAASEPAPFAIEAEIRVRAETISGQFRPGRPEHDRFFSSRARLFAEYDAGPVRFGGEIVDGRGYGEKPNTSLGSIDVNALEPLQAYAALDMDQLGKGYDGTLKAGRFTMNVGSTRLIGRPGFPSSTHSFAGVLLDMTTPHKDRLTAFWTMPVTRLPGDTPSILDNEVELDRWSGDLQLFGANFMRANLVPGLNAEAYAYRLFERDAIGRPTRDRRLWSYGLRLEGKSGPIEFDVESVLQRGLIRATAAATDLRDLPVSAYFVHAQLGHRFSGPWAPRLIAMFDVASGDGRNPATFNRFDPLYGPRRPEFGPPSLYGALGRTNLVSGGFKFEAKPAKRTELTFLYRANWLESATDSFAMTGVRDAAGASGRFAGHQFDGEVRQWLMPKRLRADLGAVYLAKGPFLRTAPNAPRTGDTRYCYLALTALF